MKLLWKEMREERVKLLVFTLLMTAIAIAQNVQILQPQDVEVN